MTPAERCPSCGETAMQSYCARCGEKRPERDDWKLRNIAGEIVGELTNLEQSKLWQTFWLLVVKPGELTREYWSGRRKVFLGPVKLYLVLFALSLVVYSIHQPTAVYDVRTFARVDAESRLARQLDRIATRTGSSRAQVEQEINSRMQTYISWSQLLYPLAIALMLKLLFWRRSGRYLAEHLIFALHLLAFMLFATLAMWPIYFLFRRGDLSSPSLSSPVYVAITAVSTIWLVAYLILALRRTYHASWAAAAIKGAIVFGAYFLISMIGMVGAVLVAMRFVSSVSR